MFFSDYILTQDESLWILFCSTVQFHFTTNLYFFNLLLFHKIKTDS